LLYPDVGPLGPILRFFLAHPLRDSAATSRSVAASELERKIIGLAK
jgi:hypothetical protein